jgi:hypothetical protein
VKPPSSETEAIERLLELCPELSESWLTLSESDPSAVGLYTVFSDIILPLLANVLTGGSDPRFDRTYSGLLLDEPDTRLNLVKRLYSVLDEWAISPNKGIRDTVFIEVLEGGYGP